jgi:cell division protein FtsB
MRENRIMARRSTFRTMLRRAGPPAALLIVGAFFGGYAIMGPNGALAYGDIKRQLGQRQGELAALDKQRAELKNKVSLLDPRHADPDMVDELVRKDLNVAHPDEMIVPLDK